MRWWLHTDPPSIMSIENASVKGMDFSTLDPDIWMVQWIDGKGEIERQVDKDTNDNGLRETFIDVIPYAPFFQQFLTLCPRLTLPQAKKVDIDLIRQIYESKRQAPFHYPVAAGDYWWDAADDNMLSSSAASLQNTIATLNNVISELNRIVAGFNANDGQIVTKANTANNQIGNGLNAAVVSLNSSGNGLAVQVNNNVVTYCNTAFDQINAWFTTVDARGNSTVSYINATLVVNMNSYLMMHETPISGSSFNLASPGLPTPLTASDVAFPDIGQPYRAQSVVAAFAAAEATWTAISVTPVSWTPLTNVPVSSTMWIPLGGTEPVPVTPAEAAAIMAGIAARSNDLNIKKNIKIGEVNAMTEIQDVIDYDVTTGW